MHPGGVWIVLWEKTTRAGLEDQTPGQVETGSGSRGVRTCFKKTPSGMQTAATGVPGPRRVSEKNAEAQEDLLTFHSRFLEESEGGGETAERAVSKKEQEILACMQRGRCVI